MNIKDAILSQIRKDLKTKDLIISVILKEYTFRLYKLGFNQGFNYQNSQGCNKAVMKMKEKPR